MSADRPARVHNPADLLLRVTRTPAGLQFSSPQLTGWTAVARGPVPIAQAVDVAWRLLATIDDGGHNALEKWDAAAMSLATAGAELTSDDVIVVRSGPRPRRASGALMRPTATNGQRHDPWAWTDLGNGYWQAPSGHRYPESTRCVQRVIAQREQQPSPGSAVQQTFDDVAS